MKRGKPLFENIFGENNTIKVLDFLVMGKDFDFTLSHIAKGTGISRTAVRKAITEFVDKGIVIVSRQEGISVYYKINKNDHKYSLLNSLYKLVQNEVIAKSN